MIDAQVACQLFQTAFFYAATADFEFELRIGFECFCKSRQEQVVAFEVAQVGDAAEGEVLIVFFGELEILFKIAAQHIGQVLPVCAGVGFFENAAEITTDGEPCRAVAHGFVHGRPLVFADKAA